MMDLNNLSIDQKRQIVELLKKKELVKQEKRLDNIQFSGPTQEAFLKSPKKIRAMFGGNGSSKTATMVLEMIWQHTNTHPYRDTSNTHHTWLIIPSAGKSEDYYNEVKKFCPPSLLPKTDKMGTSDIKRLRWKNGSMTTIYSHEQDSAKFEGSNISGLFCDEPLPRKQWVAAYRGLRANTDYFVCIAATPLSEAWMYQEIYLKWALKQDLNIEVFQGSTYENKYLSKEWIDDFASRLTEEEKAVRLYGEFATLQGRIYQNFSRNTHVISHQPWPSDWPVYIGIDPHSRKPHAALAVGITPDDNYVIIDELDIKGEITDLAEELKKWQTKYAIESIIIDNSGAALDWTRNSAVQILASQGIYVQPVRRADKDVHAGINRVKQLLKGRKNNEGIWVPQLKVMENCVMTISEFELYTWSEPKHADKTGDPEKPKKINDERLDVLRYIVNRTPEFQADLEIESYLLSNNPYERS